MSRGAGSSAPHPLSPPPASGGSPGTMLACLARGNLLDILQEGFTEVKPRPQREGFVQNCYVLGALWGRKGGKTSEVWWWFLTRGSAVRREFGEEFVAGFTGGVFSSGVLCCSRCFAAVPVNNVNGRRLWGRVYCVKLTLLLRDERCLRVWGL